MQIIYKHIQAEIAMVVWRAYCGLHLLWQSFDDHLSRMLRALPTERTRTI